MRKWLIVTGLLALFASVGIAFAAAPYRSEQIVGVAANNRTGCVINVQNSSGWKRQGTPSVWRPARLEEPVAAGVAVYECGGAIGARPAAMILVDAATGERVDGCTVSSDDAWCYTALPKPPAASGAPRHYRLLIRVRPGAPVQTVDLTVSRRIIWRSATLDGIMSA